MEEVLQHKINKINETAVEIIEGMKQREQAKRIVGLEVWNAMAQILGWVSRGIWGGTRLYLFQSFTVLHGLSASPLLCSGPQIYRPAYTPSSSAYHFVYLPAPLVPLSICFFVTYGGFIRLLPFILALDPDGV